MSFASPSFAGTVSNNRRGWPALRVMDAGKLSFSSKVTKEDLWVSLPSLRVKVVLKPSCRYESRPKVWKPSGNGDRPSGPHALMVKGKLSVCVPLAGLAVRDSMKR